LAGSAAALAGLALAGPGAAAPAVPAGRFFADPDMDFVFLTALGKAYYQAADTGKLLWLAGQIPDGDRPAAFQAFLGAGAEARALALEALRKGRRESARQALLWASNYYYTATYFADASDPSRFYPTWKVSRQCWNQALPLFRPPVEKVWIPYQGTRLQGYFFRADDSRRRLPLLILNNGSDGSVLDMWCWGGAAAVARGWNALTFDGPGQGYALWEQKLYFRPDWEKVITPVVDWALAHPEVDPRRLALQGISQGGYWVPRAVAFEHRVRAAVADPGVVEVATSWTAHLPPPMLELLQAGRKAEFDRLMAEIPPALQALLRFRMRPYGMSSPYDVYRAVQQYNLRGVAGRIRCPTLITEPEGEQFWPGQSRQLYDLLKAPRELVRFTVEEGADLHCEPKALGLRDLRVFDWLERVLA
jgi:hypothetical protein